MDEVLLIAAPVCGGIFVVGGLMFFDWVLKISEKLFNKHLNKK